MGVVDGCSVGGLGAFGTGRGTVLIFLAGARGRRLGFGGGVLLGSEMISDTTSMVGG